MRRQQQCRCPRLPRCATATNPAAFPLRTALNACRPLWTGPRRTHPAPNPEHDERAEDRAEDARGAELEPATEEQVQQRAADERADDAEDDRPEPAHRVRAGHEPARDRSGDEPDDDPADDAHLELHLVALGHGFFHLLRLALLHPRTELLELVRADHPANGLEHRAFLLLDVVLDVLLGDLALRGPVL